MTDLASRLMTISTELNAIKREHPGLAEWCRSMWDNIQEVEVSAGVGSERPRPIETPQMMRRSREEQDTLKHIAETRTDGRA